MGNIEKLIREVIALVYDPNNPGNSWIDEWNSPEIQNEFQFTGITKEEWEAHRAIDDHDDDDGIWF